MTLEQVEAEARRILAIQAEHGVEFPSEQVAGDFARALLRIAPVLRMVHDDLDQAVAAHDPRDSRHPSHGGQHTNGPCCEFGNVTPGAVRHMRRLRDALSAATRELEGE